MIMCYGWCGDEGLVTNMIILHGKGGIITIMGSVPHLHQDYTQITGSHGCITNQICEHTHNKEGEVHTQYK